MPNSVISWLITSTIFDGVSALACAASARLLTKMMFPFLPMPMRLAGARLSAELQAVCDSRIGSHERSPLACIHVPSPVDRCMVAGSIFLPSSPFQADDAAQGWAAMVAPLLNREQRRAPSFWQASIFINSLCLGPVLLAVALVPLGMVSNDHYNQAYYAYRGIRLLLSSAISGGDVDLSAMKALGQVIEAESQSAIAWLEYVWIVWAIATACLSFLFLLHALADDSTHV